MDQFTEKELLYSEEKDGWVKRFEQELQQEHDVAHGPLWRVVRIQNSFDSSMNKYTSTFLLSFHHTISDKLSVLTMLDQLLEILDQLRLNVFDVENMQTLPILPPLLDLIKCHTQISWWEKIVIRLNGILQPFTSLQNNFLDIFTHPLVETPTMRPITSIIPGSLTEQQTTLLVKNCKANNCTVTGALAGCYATALFGMAEKFGKNLKDITLGLPVNLRRGCKPTVHDDEIGLFVGLIIFDIAKSESDFWDRTRKITREIKKQLGGNKQYGIATRMENGVFNPVQIYENAKKDMKYAGRYTSFDLSNCGIFTFERQTTYKVKEVHFAITETLTVSSVTVNGQLNWTVVYGNAAIHHEHARTFSQLFKKSLIELGCAM